MNSAILVLVLVLTLGSRAGDSCNTPVATGEIHGRVLTSKENKPLAYANVIVVGTRLGVMSLADGSFLIKDVPAGTYTLRAMMMGYQNLEQKSVVVTVGKTTEVVFKLDASVATLSFLKAMPVVEILDSAVRSSGLLPGVIAQSDGVSSSGEARRFRPPTDREQYEHIDENDFLDALKNPLSTFSIDVDRASYANMRRFVRAGTLPPPAAVRIEEFVNYFEYDYPEPEGEAPCAVVTEVAECPWTPDNRLVRIGLQGKHMEKRDLPQSNLVFLIDVSGSMTPDDKLPMLRRALPMLVSQLRRDDRVAIVVYAGSAGLVLDSTPGNDKRVILDAIDRLAAGGSTAGGEGIVLAYEVARRNFIQGGNNRVILATDGDFNVGVTSDGELVKLIEKERESGVFLTVLGVGGGNLQDAKMEKLADHGNGNYAYLDDLAEAQKVLVSEMAGTIVTIAKDVKVQVEFNPARVAQYRLIGYENRLLGREDFEDDTKDAGELGAGHSVTALYEVVPAAGEGTVTGDLRYSRVEIKPAALSSDDMLTVALRYKTPDGDTSMLIERTARDAGTRFEDASQGFRFAAAVAEFGMLLRDSMHRGRAGFDHVIESAGRARGDDAHGYRREFIQLAEECRAIKPELAREQ